MPGNKKTKKQEQAAKKAAAAQNLLTNLTPLMEAAKMGVLDVVVPAGGWAAGTSARIIDPQGNAHIVVVPNDARAGDVIQFKVPMETETQKQAALEAIREGARVRPAEHVRPPAELVAELEAALAEGVVMTPGAQVTPQQRARLASARAAVEAHQPGAAARVEVEAQRPGAAARAEVAEQRPGAAAREAYEAQVENERFNKQLELVLSGSIKSGGSRKSRKSRRKLKKKSRSRKSKRSRRPRKSRRTLRRNYKGGAVLSDEAQKRVIEYKIDNLIALLTKGAGRSAWPYRGPMSEINIQAHKRDLESKQIKYQRKYGCEYKRKCK